jgi:hypothetical protein
MHEVKTMTEEICPICSKPFKQDELDSAANLDNRLLYTNMFQSIGYCSEECVDEYKKELNPIRLKTRMDELEARIVELESVGP